MFFKLKASVSPQPRADEGDKETRRRRRLSKPLTNKSSTNLLMLSAQPTEGQANNSSGVNLRPASLSTTTTLHENALAAEHSRMSSSIPDMLQDNSPVLKEEGGMRTAFILGEDPVGDDGSSTLLSPIGSMKVKRPLSAIFAPRFPSSRKASDLGQRRASLQALAKADSNKTGRNIPAATLLDSSENQSDALSPRLQRRSSFTPGVATRTSRKTSLGLALEEKRPDGERDYYYNPALPEESPLSQLEVLDFDEEWVPPAPPVARSETPSDLDYTHLGGFRLGSLHVVNGRASPAPSELSRHLVRISTPVLKRDASSNYGDGDEASVVTLASLRQKSYRGRDQGLQDLTHVPRRPVACPTRMHSDTILLPKRTKQTFPSSNHGVEPNSSWASIPKLDMPVPQTASCSPDKTSELAMAYMAELSASPYAEERSNSPTGSVLKSTSKATEFDDDLFEDDDNEDLSTLEETKHLPSNTCHSSNDAVWMYENAYSLSVKRSCDTSPRPSLQPSNSTGSSTSFKPDSGYGSKISLQSAGNRTYDSAGKMENCVPNAKVTHAEAMPTESTRGRSEPRPSSPPPRSSILKRSGNSSAAQLPRFPNLHASPTTLATVTSASSAPSDAPAKLRKLQKKARRRSQPPPVRHIVIQGQHRDVSNGDIPPIPVDVAMNLAIRTQQVPELGHTFSSMDHTRKIGNSPKSPYAPAYVDLPKTDPSPHDLSTEVSLPTPPPHRSSFIKWSKSERRHSQRRTSNTSGISESDAMAIIRNLDMASSPMGGSPYHVASKTTKRSVSQASLSKTPTNRDNQNRDSSRPKPMMDDVTAAELARLRSRTIVEREEMQWTQRRSPFNDRGGIPGRSIQPSSVAGDAPPLPPLPGREQVMQQEVRRADYQQPYLHTRERESQYGEEQFASDPYDSAPPPPPFRPPPPRPFELESDIPPRPPSHSPQPKPMEAWEDTPAPPPPSHSPRPRSIPCSDEAFAPPPPSHSPHPMPVKPDEDVAGIWAAQASAWRLRRKSIGEMLRSQTSPEEQQSSMQPFQAEEFAHNDPIYPEIPLRRPQKSFMTGPEDYLTSRYQFYGAQTEPMFCEPAGISGPSFQPFDDYGTKPERPQQPPQFGRYSGGLAYGYEYGAGFGGSAGTSDVGGVGNASRKGMPPTEGFGIDLSDLPLITKIRRKPVGCQ